MYAYNLCTVFDFLVQNITISATLIEMKMQTPKEELIVHVLIKTYNSSCFPLL